MSFTTLRAAISTELNTVAELVEVKDHHTESLTGFPAATFEPSGNEGTLFTSTDNLHEYSFDIIIHQTIQNNGRDKAVERLSAAVDAVITALDTNFNLSGASDFNRAAPSAWGEYTGGNGAVLYATINFVCVLEVTVLTP